MYHKESVKVKNELLRIKNSLNGQTMFLMGDVEIKVKGKDGIGGLIEEWFGAWCKKEGFNIESARKDGGSQTFPDYYVEGKYLLEIKTFDASASPNFDIANFDSYCKSLSENPYRIEADYIIFAYRLINGTISIDDIWLKKIWEISCPSERWAIKTQTKKDIIYNIRPAVWYSNNTKYNTFSSKGEFINALYETQKKYSGVSYLDIYYKNRLKNKHL